MIPGGKLLKYGAKAGASLGAVAKASNAAADAGKKAIKRNKQSEHIKGTPQNKNRVKQTKAGDSTPSTFFGQKSGERLTQIASERGAAVPGRPNVVEYDFGRAVGVGPNGGSQNKVRVHTDNNGRIHGHPSGPENF